VRRRVRRRDTGTPEELCRFVAGEWPGECVHEQLRAWRQACVTWLADADGESRTLPCGDVIDLLCEAERLNRQFPPCPREYRPAQHWVNGRPAP